MQGNDYLESNVVDGAELSQVFFMEIRMTFILENSRFIFLGAVENFFNLASKGIRGFIVYKICCFRVTC